MYEPRRALGPVEAEVAPTPVPAAFGRPRRVATTWRDGLGRRAGIGLVALAAAATTSAFVLADQDQQALALDEPAASPAERDIASVSRSSIRTVQVRELTTSKLADATGELTSLTPLYTTGELNVRAEASQESKLLGSIDPGTKVLATSAIDGKYRKVTTDKLEGWVLETHLDAAAPVESGGITTAQCSRGTAVEKKLRADTIRIYRSVCALFPGVNSYGGWRAGGRQFHKNGRALDIMLTPKKESALGWQIAKYLVANAKALNIDHIIFEQKIWTPGNPRWRGMADRGGTTANHYDHVHVAVRA